MKKILSLSLVAVVFLVLFIATKPKTEKFSPILKYKVDNLSENQYSVYIYLKDKGTDAYSKLSNPLNLVSQRSLDRRAKVLPQGQLVDITDVPLYEPYVNEINSKVTKVRHELKWFNVVSADVTLEQLYDIADLRYVEKIDLVERFKKHKEDIESNFSDNFIKQNNNIPKYQPLLDSLDYGTGAGLQQLTQINVNIVHNQGIFGQGVMIASFDAGFSYLSHPVFTTLPMNIYKRKDFDTGDTVNLTPHSHGEGTLSLVGGYHPGNMIGPAFRSTFILCRTEVDPGERWFEMDHWSAAAQWVDSLGADVITSSLGYLEFDAPDSSYTWQHMNGRTLLISRAAAYASHKGIVVSNSAGNNGSSTHNTLGGPADADSILTVGAVDLDGIRASFSSIGPTTDVPTPRIKPDVMACGSGNKVASGSTGYSSFGSGTSYACPLNAGVVALVLSANKNLTPLQVRGIMRRFASNYSAPNNNMGWGIINAQLSVDSARKLDNVAPTILHTQPFANTTNTGTITLKARIYDNGIIRYTRSGEAPRIYYRKKIGGNWSSFTSANFTTVATRDTFYFQIPGSSVGTQIQYYFAVQDIALPNTLVSTLPAGGSGVNPPGLIPPANLFTFNVSIGINQISSNVPGEYKLFNNYPNPFNPNTTIRFNLMKTNDVKLKVYDITGRLITTLVNQKLSAGEYKVDFSGRELSSGIYIYRIEAGDFKDTKKMLLIK
ncbi:MAG: S8 family serine peptidase [Ignavibacteriae bacterium]|nr:S8 family serine peptidase [Ignavibacteriota bacterium]